jgi:hypothetical protein
MPENMPPADMSFPVPQPPAAMSAPASPPPSAARSLPLPPRPLGGISLPAPSTADSTIVALIQSLVQEGALTQDRAGVLIRQARDEAAIAARSASGGVLANVPPASGMPLPGGMAMPSGGSPAETQMASAAPPPSIRVPYIPQIVRNQIKTEIEQELEQKALAENRVPPDTVPEWTKHIHLYGDFRARYEWDLFDPRNADSFVNFAGLNSGSPFDLNNTAGVLPPLLDTTQDRQRARIRVRLGITADITSNLTAGLRLATGNTTNPVTTNQNLGTTLNKDNFLLDRAYLEYRPVQDVALWIGRFPSPWFTPTELVWDEDINFDGIAARYRTAVAKDLTAFSTAGAFPIEFTSFNFPDNTQVKQNRDKWLYAAQVGLEWKGVRDYTVDFGASYWDFDSIEGKLSAPCLAASSAAVCSTDNSRPGFQQTGNTMFAVRDLLTVDVSKPPNQQPLFQYFGLASRFQELQLSGRVDAAKFAPVHVVVDGDFVYNIGFNKNRIKSLSPVNNFGPAPDNVTQGPYVGGNLGYQARITVGYPVLAKRWDWNFSAAYRYLESDAVVDAFTDSDFHLGGTNAKGYIIGAGLGVGDGVNFSARWLSASEVSGLPYTVDVVLVDLNASF